MGSSNYHPCYSLGRLVGYVGEGRKISIQQYDEMVENESNVHTPMMPSESQKLYRQIQLDQEHYQAELHSHTWHPTPTPPYGKNCPEDVRQTLLNSDSNHYEDVRQARDAFQCRNFFVSESEWVNNYNRQLLSQGKRPIYLDEIK